MKEQLISFDTAKLAKEKGFQLGTRSSYCHYHSSYEYDGDPTHRESYKKDDVKLDVNFFSVNNYKGFDLSNKHYTIYEAPTQSLLQKWLREKHNIFVFVEPTLGENEQEFAVYATNNQQEDLNLGLGYESNYHVKTYEEALEKGLQKALKLLK